MKLLLILFSSFLSLHVLAHENHRAIIPKLGVIEKRDEDEVEEQKPKTWTQWLGSFHFPIALINMVAIAELLFWRYKKTLFEFSARFMLIATVILAPLTALLGLIYSYSASNTNCHFKKNKSHLNLCQIMTF